MALVEYPLGHPLAQELWADKLMAENFANTSWTKFVGGRDALAYQKNDFQAGIGSRLTYGLRLQIDQPGALDNELLEGNEGNYTTVEDQLVIRQLRFAVEGTGTIDRQRIAWDDREENRLALTDLFVRRDEEAFFNQLGGATYETDVRRTGLNPVHDPTAAGDTNHIIRPTGVTDQGLGSSNTITLDLINSAVERAKSSDFGPPIAPLRFEGKDYWVVFVHTFQAEDLRRDPDWREIHLSAMSGGAIGGATFFTGAMGVTNNAVIIESDYVPFGVHSVDGTAVTDVRRAILCGRQALCIGYGRKGGSPTTFFWREREIDYGNRLGVAAGKVYGLKATTFDFDEDGTEQRFGSIVIPTFAEAHS